MVRPTKAAFLQTSLLIPSRARGYRAVYHRPADISQTIHEKRMVCDMGSHLDCLIWQFHVDELLMHVSQAYRTPFDEASFTDLVAKYTLEAASDQETI